MLYIIISFILFKVSFHLHLYYAFIWYSSNVLVIIYYNQQPIHNCNWLYIAVVLVCLLICNSLLFCHLTLLVIDFGVFYCLSLAVSWLCVPSMMSIRNIAILIYCQIFGSVICFHSKRKVMKVENGKTIISKRKIKIPYGNPIHAMILIYH